MEDEHITEAELHIVKPGDKVRLVPVRKLLNQGLVGGGPLFPGVTGDLMQAGNGRTHALKDCSVLVVGKHWGGFQDGLIDMSGEGAKYTYFSQLKNIVLVADTDEEFEKREQQKKNRALRWAGMRLAEYIGSSVRNLEPEKLEVFELEPITKRTKERIYLQLYWYSNSNLNRTCRYTNCSSSQFSSCGQKYRSKQDSSFILNTLSIWRSFKNRRRTVENETSHSWSGIRCIDD